MTIDTVAAQCFIAVAESGSFTKAAQRVGRTQSAVSQQIAKLENLVGKQLFTRGKIFSLTSEGEIFLSYAKQIFSLHREVIDRFKEPELIGEVQFGVPEDFASVFLSDVLSDFTRIHPRVSLSVECDLTKNLYDKFKEKKLDLVLVKMRKSDEFPFGQNVWSQKLEWFGDMNLISKNKPIPLVLSPQPCVYREAVIEALDKKKLKWRCVFSSHSYASKIAAVRAGIGITALSRKMVPQNIDSLNSKILPSLHNIQVSLMKHNNSNPALNSFEEFVIKRLK